MLPVIYLRGAEPVTAGKPLGSGRADALHLLPQLDPGEILSARVEAKLPDGSYKVMVGSQPLRMSLPGGVAPGDTLELAFLAREPRPTFVLRNIVQRAPPELQTAPEPDALLYNSAGGKIAAGAGPAGAPLANALAPQTASAELPELTLVSREPRPTYELRPAPQQAGATAPAPMLSAAGRLIAATMLQPGEVAAPVGTTAPLLASPPADGASLAPALARTLATSGLFYEAHQAEWVAGKLDLATIRQEPQARLAQAPAHAAATAPPRAEAATAREAQGAARTEQAQQGVAQAIHPRTAPLVQQQLAALDTGKLVLQLEIWPQQWLHWEIEERQPEAGHAPEAQPSWDTSLRLQLPQMGELKAALNLGPLGVRVRLEADNAASASRLREHSPSLHAALAAAGVVAAGIAVSARADEHA